MATRKPPADGGLTPAELRLVEQYVGVLDYLSRCALGIDRGDWFYLCDKAGELARAAWRLSQTARTAYQASTQGHGPRSEAVAAAVAWQGRTYRAGRLLHPADPGRRDGEGR
jgi:hypothetical protein